MDGAVIISFGPAGDRMFYAALALIIFVLGTISVQWIIAEIKNLVEWIQDRRKPEIEEEVDYDAMKEYAQSDLEETTQVFAFDGSKSDQPFAHFSIGLDGKVTQNVELENRQTVDAPNLKVKLVDAVSAYPTSYIVQWSESPDFDQFASTELRRSEMPGATALDLLQQYGNGHIRWRLVGDDNHTPDWKYQGFYDVDGGNVVIPDKENADG